MVQDGNGAILSIDLENRTDENMPGQVVELLGSSRESETV